MLAKQTAALSDTITSITRGFISKIQPMLREIMAASLRRFDRDTQAQEELKKLKEEVEKERHAHAREKEDLKRQAAKAKDTANNISSAVKAITAVIALISTGIIPLIKAKKKET